VNPSVCRKELTVSESFVLANWRGVHRAPRQFQLGDSKGVEFRLIDRLLIQIDRVQTVNGLQSLTPEIVDAAREALLIGQ
jgi:hypothetical protein